MTFITPTEGSILGYLRVSRPNKRNFLHFLKQLGPEARKEGVRIVKERIPNIRL